MYGRGGIFYAPSVVVRDDDDEDEDEDEEDEGCISDGFIVPNNVVEYISDESTNNESEYQYNNNNNKKMKAQVKKEIRRQLNGVRKSVKTLARTEVVKMVGKCKTALTHQTPSSDRIVSLGVSSSMQCTNSALPPQYLRLSIDILQRTFITKGSLPLNHTTELSIINNAVFTTIIFKTPTTCRMAKTKISYIQHSNNIKSKEKIISLSSIISIMSFVTTPSFKNDHNNFMKAQQEIIQILPLTTTNYKTFLTRMGYSNCEIVKENFEQLMNYLSLVTIVK